MNKLNRLGSIVIIILLSLILVNVTSAQGPSPRAPRTAMGTAFTYQGQLKSGGSAYTGNCDFQFKLYDDASTGSQIGTTQTATSVAVASGLFTTQIDFGASAFNGDARWLDISVRCPTGSGSYAPLTSRQQLTAAPYALYATTANTATSATMATNFSGSLAGDVTGTQASTAVGKLQGRTVTSTAPTTGQVLEYDGTQWVPGNYQRVVVVAESGGNFTSIQAAINSITVHSGSDRYLVKVMPGDYLEQVTMKNNVDIEGAGENVTQISFSGDATGTSGTVNGANSAELRFLSVQSVGGGASTYAYAIYNNSTSPKLTHVTAGGYGGSYSAGVANKGTAAPTLTEVTATASSGTNNYGVYNYSGASPTIRNSELSAIGGTNNYGLYNQAGSSAIVQVRNSKISGTSNAIKNEAGFTSFIGGSQLTGGAVWIAGGTLTCVYTYNALYATLNATCQ